MKRPNRLLLLLPALVVGFVAAGCGSSSNSSSATTAAPTSSAPAATGEIQVFAATSLTKAFTDIGAAFTKANPNAKATFNFNGSSQLVNSITKQSAPADVFASADETNMKTLTDAGMNGTDPVVFATNLLTIIVPKGNPKGIKGVEDLANPDLKVVLCDYTAKVPCGLYAKQILDAAKVTVKPVSLEQNVGGVVTKVTSGEADAGIVYVTDVQAVSDKADMVAIPADINVVAKYPIASVKASKNQATDQAFIDFVMSDAGQAILKQHGFSPPS
jgi:molybdate transport system substrate-binding protein